MCVILLLVRVFVFVFDSWRMDAYLYLGHTFSLGMVTVVAW